MDGGWGEWMVVVVGGGWMVVVENGWWLGMDGWWLLLRMDR